MNREEHIKKHQELHKSLGELLVDFITHTKYLPLETPIMTLVTWSYKQTTNPTEED